MSMTINIKRLYAIGLVGLSLAGFSVSASLAQLKPTPKVSGKTMATAKTGVVADQLMESVTHMMDKLNTMRFSGDPDFDYVFMVRTHHLAEIDLSQEVVNTVKSDSLQQLATALINRKQKEVNQLEDALKQIRPSRANQAFVQAQNQQLAAMKLNFQNGMLEKKLTGRVDEDYATIMLEHQRDAIDMTQNYLKYGKNQNLLALARQLLANAQADTRQFKTLVKQEKIGN
ncbi:hypothetical protein GCM10023187_18460 [Nibrella viscosa]|uniref:DUF305 domain-containing protein n=1 Tax=Nibrella viscosa TaxID=1084524 RepID=A0ABP8K9S4_9BACT